MSVLLPANAAATAAATIGPALLPLLPFQLGLSLYSFYVRSGSVDSNARFVCVCGTFDNGAFQVLVLTFL